MKIEYGVTPPERVGQNKGRHYQPIMDFINSDETSMCMHMDSLKDKSCAYQAAKRAKILTRGTRDFDLYIAGHGNDVYITKEVPT